jgi:hypothetical protein
LGGGAAAADEEGEEEEEVDMKLLEIMYISTC